MQLKKVRTLKNWIDGYEKVTALVEDLAVLYDFYKEGEGTEQDVDNQHKKTLESIENLELKNMLSKEEDALNAVLQITAGAGGTESCDWANMLM